MEGTKSNPFAASARIEPRRPGEYKGQRKHDLRIGKQPAYVDASRSELNRVLIKPPTPGEMQKICVARRSVRETKRAMKAGTTCAYIGVITFGAEAQRLFSDLTPEQQDAAYIETAEKIAERMNTTLEGLVVHADESAPHAHMSFPAYDMDGQPLTKTIKRQVLFDVQAIIAEVMTRHAPGIQRGTSRASRMEAGASWAETMNKSVRQLHADLPAEIAAKERELAEASVRVNEMRARVEKLEAKVDLTDKEAKRLETYRNRLSDRIAEAETTRAEAERLSQIAREEAAQAVQERDNAKAEEDEARGKAQRITSAIKVLSDEITGDTITRNESGIVIVKDLEGLKQGFPDIGPAAFAAADAMMEKRRLEADAAEDRRKAAEALKDAEKAKADAFSLRNRLNKMLRLVRSTLSFVARHLSKAERAEVDTVIEEAETLIRAPQKSDSDSEDLGM